MPFNLAQAFNVWKRPEVFIPATALAAAFIMSPKPAPAEDVAIMALPLHKQTDEFKRSTAIHESAHMIALMAMNRPNIQADQLTIRPTQDAWGHMSYDMKKLPMVGTYEDYIAFITILKASEAAEDLLLNGSTSGVGDDNTKATALAMDMPLNGMTGQVGIDYKYLAENGGYSAESQVYVHDTALNTIKECYGIAREIIIAHSDKVELLAQALMNDNNNTIPFAEAKEIVGFVEGKGLPIILENGETLFPEDPFSFYKPDQNQETPDEAYDTQNIIEDSTDWVEQESPAEP